MFVAGRSAVFSLLVVPSMTAPPLAMMVIARPERSIPDSEKAGKEFQTADRVLRAARAECAVWTAARAGWLDLARSPTNLLPPGGREAPAPVGRTGLGRSGGPLALRGPLARDGVAVTAFGAGGGACVGAISPTGPARRRNPPSPVASPDARLAQQHLGVQAARQHHGHDVTGVARAWCARAVQIGLVLGVAGRSAPRARRRRRGHRGRRCRWPPAHAPFRP